MDCEQLKTRALQLFPSESDNDRQEVTPLAGMKLLRFGRTTVFEGTLYEPTFCLILQGAKAVSFDDRNFTTGAGECLLISHDLPIVSRVVSAPYLALLIDIDVPTLRSLYDEIADASVGEHALRSVEVNSAEPQLIDAVARYVALAASKPDARVLGPMIVREIHYRLLTAPFGGMLRDLMRHDSHASAVACAIAQIRRSFHHTIAVPQLARQVGMSASAFHKHFKAVTAVTPLQYQKELRLLEARRLLLSGAASVSSAAYHVGYESPNQFSREYTRRFGAPPSTDLPSAAGASR